MSDERTRSRLQADGNAARGRSAVPILQGDLRVPANAVFTPGNPDGLAYRDYENGSRVYRMVVEGIGANAVVSPDHGLSWSEIDALIHEKMTSQIARELRQPHRGRQDRAGRTYLTLGPPAIVNRA